MRNTVW